MLIDWHKYTDGLAQIYRWTSTNTLNDWNKYAKVLVQLLVFITNVLMNWYKLVQIN